MSVYLVFRSCSNHRNGDKKLDYDEAGERLIISEEQNRIANEIHDVVLQKLFAMTYNLYLLLQKCNQMEDITQMK